MWNLESHRELKSVRTCWWSNWILVKDWFKGVDVGVWISSAICEAAHTKELLSNGLGGDLEKLKKVQYTIFVVLIITMHIGN